MRMKFHWLVLLLVVGWSAGASLALDVPLTISNPDSTNKSAEPITSGVPFAQGALTNAAAVRLVQAGTEIPAQFLVTAIWPDHSVRWLLCDFQADLPGSGATNAVLQTGTAPATVTGVTVSDVAGTLTVNTGAAAFTFDKTQLAVRGQTFTATHAGAVYTATPGSTTNWVLEESGPLKVVVRVDGVWRNGATPLRDDLIGFRARLFFYRNKSDARVAFTFRNNNSFGWDNGLNKQPDLTINGLVSGTTPLLAAGTNYVFGSGVEKTFDVTVPAVGGPAVRDARYNADGTVASGYRAERPLALAAPEYYAATKAWGRISLPVTGLAADRQADFDRFEKMQRSMVLLADVENPPGLTGITAFGHLAIDLASWNNYGCLEWGGEDGQWSGNHYDWVFGMYLQLLRSGRVEFANLARVMARHEIDLDLYHTGNDGNAYNYQKNWESRPSHNNPDNTFGGGRPTHTWCQGYALHWLLTGDPRGRDGYEELIEGIRQYLYESFNNNGHVDTNEIRTQGWLTDNLIALWRINPDAALATTIYGDKTVPAMIKDVLQGVFDQEAAAGTNGFIYAGDPVNPQTRHPMQNCYALEPLAKAYEEVFRGRDDAYAAQLLALSKRMTRFLMGITFGGDTNGAGLYRPLQIPEFMNTPTERTLGQIPYLLMAANAAGFCYLHGSETEFLTYMRATWQDYCRYFSIDGEEGHYIDPTVLMPTSYNSCIYVDTESKVHGWSSRYGMFALAVEQSLTGPDVTPPVVTALTPAAGSTGIAPTASLVLNFNEAVRIGTGNIVIVQTGGSVVETIAVDATNVTVTGTSVTIHPVSPLAAATSYNIQIAGTCFTDLATNAYAGIADATTWGFTTRAVEPGVVYITDQGVTVSTGKPTYRWDAVTGATGYELEITNTGSHKITHVTIKGARGAAPAAHYLSTTGLPVGSYSWRVRALLTRNAKAAWAGPGTFTVVLPGAPTPIGPSGTVPTGSTAFTWNAVSGAEQYALEITDPRNKKSKLTGKAAAVTATKKLTAVGAYSWRIQVKVGGLTSAWSASIPFTVQR